MAAKIWRFLDSGKENAFFHMALDESLVRFAHGNMFSPVFRLYEWSPAAVTLGYSQRMCDIIDIAQCRRDGIDVTRRLTGGRAVFHDNEIAYTVIANTDDRVFGGGIMETYRAVGEVLLDGLQRAGIPAQMAAEAVSRFRPDGHRRRLPCFLSTTRHEITVRGRKIVGSAQRRIGRVFLQQGSILLGTGQEHLADYLADPAMAETCRKAFEKGTVDLASESEHDFSRQALKTALFGAFRDAVGGKCCYEEPTERELMDTARLVEEKYSLKGWIENHG